MIPLPIDPVLPDLAGILAQSPSVVLEAPPGAGKTTRVPAGLLETRWSHSGEILVSEPRRVAARLAAARVAQERGDRLGEVVGFSVRYATVASPSTRLCYVTDGVLLRRILADPELRTTAAVVLDEFHERSLVGDVVLTLLRRLQQTVRPDLRLLVMSATLDAAPIARYLDEAPIVTSRGQTHEVSIEHVAVPDDRPLEKQVASAVRRAVQARPSGDVLVFLPGAAEIRRAAMALEPLAQDLGLLVLPLHGDLSLAEQTRAIEPAARRKVVLSTNIAESSLTIDGVTVVIDSGLARVATHSPWSGLPRLSTQPISRASARQRAGRAGRTRPGLVLRLYTRGDYDRRPAQDAPAIERSDLAEVSLALRGLEICDPTNLEWLTPPPPSALDAAERLLRDLGALDSKGGVTQIGQRMLRFPVHPRLGRVLVEGERLGIAREAAVAAALLGERDIRLSQRALLGPEAVPTDYGRGTSDIQELLDRFAEAVSSRRSDDQMRSLGLDPRAVRDVAQAARQLGRRIDHRVAPPPPATQVEDAVAQALLRGFPDRVARRRGPGSRELVLVGGEPATLSPRSIVHDAPFLVALEVDDRQHAHRGQPNLVRLATGIEPDWLMDLDSPRLVVSEEALFNERTARVETAERLVYGSLVIDEQLRPSSPSAATARVLARVARARGWQRDELRQAVARIALLTEYVPEFEVPPVPEDPWADLVDLACTSATTWADLEHVSLADHLFATLSPTQLRALQEHAPSIVTLPGGRRLNVTYESGKPPWVSSRLQDFFGMTHSPRVARGRVALVLHLLAPNGRAVQVTADLAGFWGHHYPTLRRNLSRRYPKHDWPEDGASARPPSPGRLRAQRRP